MRQVSAMHPPSGQAWKQFAKADLTDTHSPLAQRLAEQYKIEPLLTVVFLGADGKERVELRLVGYEGPDQFVRRLHAVK